MSAFLKALFGDIGTVSVVVIVMATELLSAASGQAAAKARRIRDAVSMTRAPSLRSRRRIVVNSALASACAFGIALRTVSMSQ